MASFWYVFQHTDFCSQGCNSPPLSARAGPTMTRVVVPRGCAAGPARAAAPDRHAGLPESCLSTIQLDPAVAAETGHAESGFENIYELTCIRNDGSRGVEIARSLQPDVILMDINLPGISGIDAMKILADDPATAQIPVITLSANAMPHDIARGLRAGFFRYLTKPIKAKENP